MVTQLIQEPQPLLVIVVVQRRLLHILLRDTAIQVPPVVVRALQALKQFNWLVETPNSLIQW